MLSVRKHIALALLILAAGCTTQATRNEPVALNPAPIHTDEAMEQRNWPQTNAVYASGAVAAYPTLYPLVARRDLPEWTTLFASPAIFLGQTVLLPITALATPAWDEVVYHGSNMPPTYTAVPAMESDAAGYETITKFAIPQPRERRQ